MIVRRHARPVPLARTNLRRLQARLSTAAPVKFGATVTVIDEDVGERQVWKIVGEPEADAKHRTISITSPLARALIGNRKGASVEVATPGGTKVYKIQKVEWR